MSNPYGGIKSGMRFVGKARNKLPEIFYNSVIAKLPNYGFRDLRVRYLRRMGAEIGNGVKLGSRIKILGAGNLVIEDSVSIANSVLLDARAGLTIKYGALIGFESIILTYTHAWPDPHRPVQFQGATGKPVEIGPLTWLGMRVAVLPGVSIGTSSVVGAASVVSRDVEANVIAAGNPCKALKERMDRSDGYTRSDNYNRG